MNPPSNPKTVEDIRKNLPPVRTENGLRQQIQNRWKQSGHKIIVLDDDPTGVQTVHDIYVITDWNKEWIRRGLVDDRHVLYILTNTRSYQPERAAEINRQIMHNLVEVTRELAIDFSVISRGDSTLRGHYPLEVEVIQHKLSRDAGLEFDGHLIIPAFMEGGRYTINDTHYLQEGDTLVPVHDTEFAKDVVFEFSNAHLPSWVVEKGGAEAVDQVVTISLEDIRLGGVVRVHSILLAAAGNKPIIVNAASYEDLDILSVALIRALEMGKRFLFRTAASFVKSFAGIEDRPFLAPDEMTAAEGKNHGGLIIAGSHTKKTTEQLQEVMDQFDIQTIEISVAELLDEAARIQELARVRELAEAAIASGRDAVIYTSRKLVTAMDNSKNLTISQTISNSLAEVVRSLAITPKFIVAKGGITSSDIATQGLAIKKAKVLGQAASGIPVWLTGSEAHFPNTPYIVFPGNVGNRFTLAEIIGKIKNRTKEERGA
ncbi:four-carbon acid sugar kinase family protein [Brevibacillus sp. NRS-1366]|uniref:four-carbon acid sugar kinase family protein n=1 Tax=Brevibacillus sp. NRS-1366 TaxID=3233899 RepID=UPI003D1DF961